MNRVPFKLCVAAVMIQFTWGCAESVDPFDYSGPVSLNGKFFDCALSMSRGGLIRTTISPNPDGTSNRIHSGTFSSLTCNDIEIVVPDNRISNNTIDTERYGQLSVMGGSGSSMTLWASPPQIDALRADLIELAKARSTSLDGSEGMQQVLSVVMEDDRQFQMEFEPVNAGCFDMGDTFRRGEQNERPVHRVCVDAFYIGKYEVTREQWNVFTGTLPISASDNDCGPNCPVGGATWYDAKFYARRLSEETGLTFRLPTEAEWEYACRSGGLEERYSGSAVANEVAWHGGNSGRQAHAVGTKAPNSLNIYDMSGNVSEFVEDDYAEDAYQQHVESNPLYRGLRERHLIRGGNYYFDAGAGAVTCTVRHTTDLPASFNNYGFRLVMEI